MPSDRGYNVEEKGNRKTRSRSRGRHDRDRESDKRRHPRSISRSPNRFSDDRHRRRKYPSRSRSHSRSRSRGRHDRYHYNSSSRHYKDCKSRSSRSRSRSKSSYKLNKSRQTSHDRSRSKSKTKTHRSSQERHNRDHKNSDSNKRISHNHQDRYNRSHRYNDEDSSKRSHSNSNKMDDNFNKYSKEEKKSIMTKIGEHNDLENNSEDLDLPLPNDDDNGSKDLYENKIPLNNYKKEKPQKYYQFGDDEEIDKEKIHKEIEEKLRLALAKEGKVYPPPKQEASHPVFANDGSFLEIFKKMQQQQVAPLPASSTPASIPVVPTLPVPLPVIATATPSTVPYLASSALGTAVPLPPPPIVGRRRGGKILKTGLVAKQKPQTETGSDPKDFWSLYLAEVNKYKNTACESEGGTRPLVK